MPDFGMDGFVATTSDAVAFLFLFDPAVTPGFFLISVPSSSCVLFRPRLVRVGFADLSFNSSIFSALVN